MERQEKLTREDLRSIGVGETKTFYLTDAAAIMSAAVNAAQTGAIDGCKFKCSRDYVENTITITKLPNDDEREA